MILCSNIVIYNIMIYNTNRLFCFFAFETYSFIFLASKPKVLFVMMAVFYWMWQGRYVADMFNS